LSVAVIINPISGGARPDTARAKAQLAMAAIERHGDTAEVFITERVGHAKQLAKAAAKRGARLVLAWGGDGTINEVATALAFEEETPFGIIPAGSGNGLATELGISRNADRAIAQALRAEPRLMDAGELDGHLFVNVAGIGIDAYVASRFNAATNVRRGLLTYAKITSGALFTYIPADYRIASGDNGEDARLHTRAVLVSIANGTQFGNNARIAPHAKFDDGLLDLVVVEERSRLWTLTQVPRLFNGTAERVSGCTITKIRHATIETELPMTYHVDGEPILGGTRITVRVHPRALWIAA
jgi:YegS/Rv2252/BmrU family lipid kinase